MHVPHEFFEDGAVWTATGEMVELAGGHYRATARAAIRHEATEWVNASEGTVESDPPKTMHNLYAIQPMAPGALETTWTSKNEYADCHGTFVIVGDSILAQGGSDDGKVSWFEYLQLAGPGHYISRGAFYLDRALASVSFWELRRER